MPAFIRTSKQKAAKNRAKAANYKRVCAQVDARDGGFCRVCRRFCQSSQHHHHIVFRSRGGKDTTANLLTVCGSCHEAIHAHRITVTGNADYQITMSRLVTVTENATFGRPL